MLRSVILMAGFILVAVLFLAPSLPTATSIVTGTGDHTQGSLAGDATVSAPPHMVERLFATDGGAGVEQPGIAAPNLAPGGDIVEFRPLSPGEARASQEIPE